MLSVNDPIVTESQVKETNLMSVTLESLYSPPDAWNPLTGAQYMYTATMPMPLTNEVMLIRSVREGAFMFWSLNTVNSQYLSDMIYQHWTVSKQLQRGCRAANFCLAGLVYYHIIHTSHIPTKKGNALKNDIN